MRKLIATIAVAAALALALVGLATHSTAGGPADAGSSQSAYQAGGGGWSVYLLPYIEQDNLYNAN